jgi:GNAT superfamily N-acetyltransferase
MGFERRRDQFCVSDEVERLDVDAIHAFLTKEAYWCLDIPRSVIAKGIEHSLCFGLYDGDAQIGFARAVTDRATFAWICDVYVLPESRGQGLATWMMECVLAHPDLQGLRRILLATRDAHKLYSGVGFGALPDPERWMAIADQDVYAKKRGND